MLRLGDVLIAKKDIIQNQRILIFEGTRCFVGQIERGWFRISSGTIFCDIMDWEFNTLFTSTGQNRRDAIEAVSRDLAKSMRDPKTKKCTCGAKRTAQPSHSHWCDYV